MARETTYAIEPATAEDGDACVAILRALPAWFGIEEAVQAYSVELREMETFVARHDGAVIGFLTLNEHNDVTAEIHLMAVDPGWHRRGVGRALVRHAEDLARARGRQLLEVKTLGPSHPDEGYRKTRAFYDAMGFLPLEEIHDLWPGNPCLIMVKVLWNGMPGEG
jgi:GNAT superfamily N-acetyltransferase